MKRLTYFNIVQESKIEINIVEIFIKVISVGMFEYLQNKTIIYFQKQLPGKRTISLF